MYCDKENKGMRNHNTNGSKLSKEDLLKIANEEIRILSEDFHIKPDISNCKNFREVKEIAIQTIMKADLFRNRRKNNE